jgi:hypothetical protein
VPFAGAFGWSYRTRLGTKVIQNQWSQKAWFGGGGFGYVTSAPFRQRASQARWHSRYATLEHDFRRLHKAQRTNGSFKSHDVIRKVLPDQEPVQSFAVRTSLHPRRRGNDVAMAGERTPDDIERKAERTIGAAGGSKLLADVAQVTPPPVIGHEDVTTTGSLVNRALDDLERNALLVIGTAAGFWGQVPHPLVVLIGVVVVVALGLMEFLLRRPVDLSWDISNFIDLKSKTPAELVSFAEENGVENASTMPKQELLFAILKQLRAPNQVTADPSAASGLNSVQKALDTIKELEAEMVSSRRPNAIARPIHPIGDAGLGAQDAATLPPLTGPTLSASLLDCNFEMERSVPHVFTD